MKRLNIFGVEQMSGSDLTKIPGIGKNMAEYLIRAGYPDIASLKSQDPEEIYRRDCLAQGMQVDKLSEKRASDLREIY